MGWSSGSEIMNAVIEAVRDIDGKERRKKIYRTVVSALEDNDWDTQDESLGLDQAFDELMCDSSYGEWATELVDEMRKYGTLQYKEV